MKSGEGGRRRGREEGERVEGGERKAYVVEFEEGNREKMSKWLHSKIWLQFARLLDVHTYPCEEPSCLHGLVNLVYPE